MNQHDYEIPDGMLIDTSNTSPANDWRSTSGSSPRYRVAVLRNSESPQQNATYGLALKKLTNQVPPQYLQQSDGKSLYKKHVIDSRHSFVAPVNYGYDHQGQALTLADDSHLAVRDTRIRGYESPPPRSHQLQQNTLFVPDPFYGKNNIDMFHDQEDDMSFESPGVPSLLSVENRMDVDNPEEFGPQRSTSRASKRSLQMHQDDGETYEQEEIKKMKKTGTWDLGRGDGPA
ncbi:hypothetical protein BZA77DRAFT_343307 [Pyronema omphalodes]|nr:hypothetical protein BZA77DRAFT_343307 [Pyronema omphalodes]